MGFDGVVAGDVEIIGAEGHLCMLLFFLKSSYDLCITVGMENISQYHIFC